MDLERAIPPNTQSLALPLIKRWSVRHALDPALELFARPVNVLIQRVCDDGCWSGIGC